jgi:hypothetical protein
MVSVLPDGGIKVTALVVLLGGVIVFAPEAKVTKSISPGAEAFAAAAKD